MILAGVGAAVLGAWFEGAFLLFLFTLGHALEHRAMERARRTIESLGPSCTARPRACERGDQSSRSPVGEIAIAATAWWCAPAIACRSMASSATAKSRLDQATITGESVPVAARSRRHGVRGHASTPTPRSKSRSPSFAGESLLARIVDMVTEAEAQKSATQRFAQRLERTFVPIVLVIAAALPVV